MLAQENEDIREASDTIYQLSQEEEIRQQCEAREDYYRRQRSVQNRIKNLEKANEEKDALIAALKAEIEQLKKL